MKTGMKFLIALLAILLCLGVAACKKEPPADDPQTPPADDTPVTPEEAYADMISLYEDLAKRAKSGEELTVPEGADETTAAVYEIVAVEEDPELLGYAIGDVGGDATEELVLISREYRPYALFTIAGGKAKLLMDWVENGKRWRGLIDSDGYLYKGGYLFNSAGKSVGWFEQVMAIRPDGSLGGIEFGGKDSTPEDEDNKPDTFYKIEDGVYSEIDMMDAVEYLPYQYGTQAAYMYAQNWTKATGLYILSAIGEERKTLEDAYAVNVADYEGILATYRQILDVITTNTDKKWMEDEIDACFRFDDRYEYKTYVELYLSIDGKYPTEDWSGSKHLAGGEYAFGYDYKDLDGDGQEELILLTEEYKLIALFTMKDGRAVYLGRPSGYLDENGKIHEQVSIDGGGMTGRDRSRVLWRLRDGALEKEFEIGCSYDISLKPDECFIVENGERVPMEKEAWYEYYDRFEICPKDFNEEDYTRTFGGLTFRPLIGEVTLTDHYEGKVYGINPNHEGLKISKVEEDSVTFSLEYVKYKYQITGDLRDDELLFRGEIAATAKKTDRGYAFETDIVKGYLNIGVDCVWMTITESTEEHVTCRSHLYGYDNTNTED